MKFLRSVVLITGGSSVNIVELFLPSNGTSCTLPALPENRRYHTVDNHLLCGGADTSKSCLLWSPDSDTWEDWGEELDVGRNSHVSWTPSAESGGTYLIGGGGSSTMTTTLVKPDGTQEPGFTLKYETE